MPKTVTDERVALLVKQATKIATARFGDPVDDWQNTLDKMLRLYVDETDVGTIAAALAEAYRGRGGSQAAELILERAIVLGRQSSAWELAE